MSLRIAFDLDGTLADLQAAVLQTATGLFGPRAPGDSAGVGAGAEAASPDEPALGARELSLVWERIRRVDDFWTSLAETEPGIVDRIGRLAHDRQWEVLFITTRPPAAGATTQRQTQRWLEAHGFALPSVFVVSGSRGKVADALALDAVVDDSAEQAIDVAAVSQAKALLVSPLELADLPPAAARFGVKPVASVGDALTMLECLDDLRTEPGVLGSIKRMLMLEGSRDRV